MQSGFSRLPDLAVTCPTLSLREHLGESLPAVSLWCLRNARPADFLPASETRDRAAWGDYSAASSAVQKLHCQHTAVHTCNSAKIHLILGPCDILNQSQTPSSLTIQIAWLPKTQQKNNRSEGEIEDCLLRTITVKSGYGGSAVTVEFCRQAHTNYGVQMCPFQ